MSRNIHRLSTAVFIAMLGLLVVLGGSAVARSSYTADGIRASTFVSNGDPGKWHAYADAYGSGDWSWVGAGQYAKWTFDVSDLHAIANTSPGISGSVHLNFAALSTSPSGGSGYSTAIRVVASNGMFGGVATVTLANPWKPHCAPFSEGLGWDSHAAVPIPSNLWAKAQTLTVTVTVQTPGDLIAMNKDALVIGYATP